MIIQLNLTPSQLQLLWGSLNQTLDQTLDYEPDQFYDPTQDHADLTTILDQLADHYEESI